MNRVVARLVRASAISVAETRRRLHATLVRTRVFGTRRRCWRTPARRPCHRDGRLVAWELNSDRLRRVLGRGAGTCDPADQRRRLAMPSLSSTFASDHQTTAVLSEEPIKIHSHRSGERCSVGNGARCGENAREKRFTKNSIATSEEWSCVCGERVCIALFVSKSRHWRI